MKQIHTTETYLYFQAVAEKERGNEFFKQGKLDKAIERYTAG